VHVIVNFFESYSESFCGVIGVKLLCWIKDCLSRRTQAHKMENNIFSLCVVMCLKWACKDHFYFSFF